MLHLVCPNPALDRTLIVDNFNTSQINRPIETKDFAGGKSFNVAYAINKSKQPIPFKIHTILGGKIGEYVSELAKTSSLDLITTHSKLNTRICSIIVDTNSNTTCSIYEKGKEISLETVQQFSDNLLSTLKSGDAVAISGSFLSGFPENYLVELFEKLNKLSIKLYIDTSGKPLQISYQVKPEMLKINDEELLDIFPSFSGSTIEDYKNLFFENWDNLPTFFIVTLGSKGVIAKMDSELFFAKSKPINAKNPIASGDFFFGTLLANIFQESSYEQTLVNAISVSTANCLNWYPVFSQDQVDNIIHNLITIEKLNSNFV